MPCFLPAQFVREKWPQGQAQRDCAANRPTRIPVSRVVEIKKRFARKLRYGSNELIIEYLAADCDLSARRKPTQTVFL